MYDQNCLAKCPVVPCIISENLSPPSSHLHHRVCASYVSAIGNAATAAAAVYYANICSIVHQQPMVNSDLKIIVH